MSEAPATQPPQPPQQPPDRATHQHREIAESFGVDAARYDRTRPPYPGDLVHRIIAESPGRIMLDVGCGTGIVARQFKAAGCTVTGVEPDSRMAEFARGTGLQVEVAKFEEWDPAGRTFDAVVAGTAWHWVDPVAGAAKAAQVLRPGGLLAPFHHVGQSPPEVSEAQASAFRRLAPDAPVGLSDRFIRSALDGYQPMFAKIADGIREAGEFSEPEQWQFEWQCRYTRDEWLDQLPTLGVLTRMPADKLAQLSAEVGAAIDAMGGSFTMSYTTVAVAAARTG